MIFTLIFETEGGLKKTIHCSDLQLKVACCRSCQYPIYWISEAEFSSAQRDYIFFEMDTPTFAWIDPEKFLFCGDCGIYLSKAERNRFGIKQEHIRVRSIGYAWVAHSQANRELQFKEATVVLSMK